MLFAAALAYYLFFVYLPSSRAKAIPAGSAEFSFIDVGQGDAALIRTPDGCLVIDTGPRDSADRLVAYLKNEGIKKIDMLFISHADEDHIGGASALLGSFGVGAVYVPDINSGAPNFLLMKEAAHARGTDVREATAGTSFSLGGMSVGVISPFLPLPEDENEGSLVMLLTLGTVRALFTGDLGTAGESLLLERYRLPDGSAGGRPLSDGSRTGFPRCDILKVGHHGSATSTSRLFAEAVSPSFAVISCGKNNRFGHPHAGTLLVLRAVGAGILRTDRDGTVVLTTDGHTVAVKSPAAAETAAAGCEGICHMPGISTPGLRRRSRRELRSCS